MEILGPWTYLGIPARIATGYYFTNPWVKLFLFKFFHGFPQYMMPLLYLKVSWGVLNCSIEAVSIKQSREKKKKSVIKKFWRKNLQKNGHVSKTTGFWQVNLQQNSSPFHVEHNCVRYTIKWGYRIRSVPAQFEFYLGLTIGHLENFILA